jgi:hypothetical protein
MCTGVYRPGTRLYRFVSTEPGDTLRYAFVSGPVDGAAIITP